MQTEIIKALMGAAGGGDKFYVDDVFTPFAYRGDASYPRTITNGIDLAGEGGLVWTKNRTTARAHMLIDTERGLTKHLSTNGDGAEGDGDNAKFSSFNSNGYTMTSTDELDCQNATNSNYISWTFRKAPGFFDVVTYSGTSNVQSLAHNLGSTPGMVLVKRKSGSGAVGDWYLWHNSISTKYLKFNESGSTATTNSGNQFFGSTFNSTHFSVGHDSSVNGSGNTYVAYIFANNDQSYGEGGDQSIIKCGTFNRTGGTTTDVDLGWEPQFVFSRMYEGPSSSGLIDNIRGYYPEDNAKFLKGDASNAENNTTNYLTSSKGFKQGGDTGNWIYMAIRFPDGYVGKPAEAGSDVFSMDTGNSSSFTPAFDSTHLVNWAWQKPIPGHESFRNQARILKEARWEVGGGKQSDSDVTWDSTKGWGKDFTSGNFSWMFKRGASIDTVSYNGTGNTHAVPHSLNGTPEMIWLKGNPNGTGEYKIWHTDLGFSLHLEMSSGTTSVASNASSYWSAASTSTFTLGGSTAVNHNNGQNYHMILFRSLTGITKVGSFTGDGNTNRTINCGFSPRMLWFKIYEGANGGYWLFDTVRGWTTGTDGQKVVQFGNPATPSNKTDWIVPVSTGFKIISVQPNSQHLNTNGYKFVYWAHA